MKTLIIAYNPDTGRCHLTKEGSLAHRGPPQRLTKITRVPNNADHVPICILLERRKNLRKKEKIVYSDLKGV